MGLSTWVKGILFLISSQWDGSYWPPNGKGKCNNGFKELRAP